MNAHAAEPRRPSVLVNLILAGRSAQTRAALNDIRETRHLEATEREQRAMDDGRHTLGGF